MNVNKSFWARFTEIEENGLNTPGLTEEEKHVCLQLQETLEAIKKGGEPLERLQGSAEKGSDVFRLELAKFSCRIAFMSARTSDEVCRLVGLIRDNSETVNKQFELAKDNALRNKAESDRADKKATMAIYIALAALVVSCILSISFGWLAHRDSNKTTAAIVMAIESVKGSLK